MALIKLENVSKYYNNSGNVSLGIDKVSLDFNLGEFVAVTGESGSGKSTLMNVISGLDGYEDGELFLNNEETSHYTIEDWEKYRSQNIGFIFQSYNIVDSYTVYQNVMLALELQNYPIKERRKRALELIKKVGLTSHRNQKASKLSGGQKQRTVIARALAKDCQIIVADEPTGNLDSKSGDEVIKLLKELSKDRLILIVTHNFAQIKDVATRVIHMHDSQVIEDKILKPNNEVTGENKTVNKLVKTKLSTIFHISLRNILSMPKRTIFFIALQLSIIMLFIFIYSSISIGVTSSNFSGGVYINGRNPLGFYENTVSSNRFFVVRKDGEPINDEDLKYINGLSDDKEVIKGISNLDKIGSENIDYIPPNQNQSLKYHYGFYTDSVFSIEDKPQFMLEGSINELKRDEIIISKDLNDLKLGSKLVLELTGYKTETATSIKRFDENTGNMVYTFNTDGLEAKYLKAEIHKNDGSVNVDDLNPTSIYNFRPEDNVSHIVLHYSRIESYTKTYTVKGIHNSEGSIYFNKEEFKESQYPSNHILSLVLRNKQAASRLFNNIDKTKYRVIYPELVRNKPIKEIEPLLFLFKLIGYFGIFLVGLFLYFLLFSVTKNMMSSRKKDLAIFRSIGANKSSLGLMIIFEQLIMMLMAFSISLILFLILSNVDVNINNQLNALTITDYLAVLIVFSILSIRLGFKFNKKTFNISIIENISQSKEGTL